MIKNFWRNNKGFIIGLVLLFFFRSAIADWYQVPSGSMQPNILIGDRVWVNKLAYDAKIPFSDINLYRHHEPETGEVIVFASAYSGERLIKRVIGVPGDSVAMRNNQLFINGLPVKLEAIDAQQSFDLFLNDRHEALYLSEQHRVPDESQTGDSNPKSTEFPIRISRHGYTYHQSFSEVTVPADHFWVLGDNRDNSADSRVIGLVPRSELIGRAERILISLDGDNYFLPRSGRYWHALQDDS